MLIYVYVCICIICILFEPISGNMIIKLCSLCTYLVIIEFLIYYNQLVFHSAGRLLSDL